MLKAQVGAVSGSESRTLLKAVRTPPIVGRRLDDSKRYILTQVIGLPIIWISRAAADLKGGRPCPLRAR
jgi:hypothetical protein